MLCIVKHLAYNPKDSVFIKQPPCHQLITSSDPLAKEGDRENPAVDTAKSGRQGRYPKLLKMLTSTGHLFRTAGIFSAN